MFQVRPELRVIPAEEHMLAQGVDAGVINFYQKVLPVCPECQVLLPLDNSPKPFRPALHNASHSLLRRIGYIACAS